MGIDKDFLKKIWNSVWEENLPEIEVQRKYFSKLDKELIGEDRFHLIAVRRKINELEMNIPFSNLLAKRAKFQNETNGSIGTKEARSEGDGTEWIIEKDEKGKLYKRKIGSNEKTFLENK